MDETLTCPSCGQPLRRLDPQATTIACHRCGQSVPVPPPIEQSRSSTLATNQFPTDLYLVPSAFGVVIYFMAAGEAYERSSGWAPLIAYTALAIGAWSITMWLTSSWRHRPWWRKAIVALVVIGSLWLYGRWDRFHVSETVVNELGEKVTTEMWYKRWSRIPLYKDITFWGDDGLSFTSDGPLSPSGKPHGRWQDRRFHDGPPYLTSEARWYWYGEEITEGEWHLRQK